MTLCNAEMVRIPFSELDIRDITMYDVILGGTVVKDLMSIEVLRCYFNVDGSHNYPT